MSDPNKKFSEYLQEELEKYGGVMVPVKAGFAERMLVRSVSVRKLHPNPDDEFCMPEIGPSYSIISDYQRKFQQNGSVKEHSWDDPLMVEKVHPDGYMLLNGHHRWAAAIRVGFKRVPVSIVNLPQESDIEKMIQASKHDKRVTMDLDEVVFVSGDNVPSEKKLGFPNSSVYKERIRLGIPGLMHFLAKRGYDIWLYSANYYSFDYVRDYFRKYNVKVDGIITGTARKAKGIEEAKKRTEELFRNKYKETLHIDNDMVIRSFADSKEFEDYSLEGSSSGWSAEVIRVVKGLKDGQ